MVHRLRLKVEWAEQEDRALRRVGRRNLLPYGEQRRAVQLQVRGFREQRVFPSDHIVQLGAAFGVLAKKKQQTIAKCKQKTIYTLS